MVSRARAGATRASRCRRACCNRALPVADMLRAPFVSARRIVGALLLASSAPAGALGAQASVVVSPTGAVRTIGEAMRNARPGARIVVQAGIYREPTIVVDSPGDDRRGTWCRARWRERAPDHDGAGRRRHHARPRAPSASARVTSRIAPRSRCRTRPIVSSRTTASRMPSSASTSHASTGAASLAIVLHAQQGQGVRVRQRHPPLDVATTSRSRRTRSRATATGSTSSSSHESDVRDNVSESNLRYGMHFMYSDDCRYVRQHVPQERRRRGGHVHEARGDDGQPVRGQLGKRVVRAAAQGDPRARASREPLRSEHHRTSRSTARRDFARSGISSPRTAGR